MCTNWALVPEPHIVWMFGQFWRIYILIKAVPFENKTCSKIERTKYFLLKYVDPWNPKGYTYIYIHTYTYIHIYTRIYTYIHIYTHEHIYIYSIIIIIVCMYTHVNVYIYISIQNICIAENTLVQYTLIGDYGHGSSRTSSRSTAGRWFRLIWGVKSSTFSDSGHGSNSDI